MSLEVSPGFFDPRMAMSDDEDTLIPNTMNVEDLDDNNTTNNTNNNKNNTMSNFIEFWFVIQNPCKCNTGWSRTKTY